MAFKSKGKGDKGAAAKRDGVPASIRDMHEGGGAKGGKRDAIGTAAGRSGIPKNIHDMHGAKGSHEDGDHAIMTGHPDEQAVYAGGGKVNK